MSKLLYLDTETTGLDPDLHDVWEIAAITDTGDEYTWMVRPDLTHADPKALEIGGYYERTAKLAESGEVFLHPGSGDPIPSFKNHGSVANRLARLLNGAVVVGSNPSFDQAFLTRWLRRHGQVWAAHYRTVDVVTLGWGAMVGPTPGWHPETLPPSTHLVADTFGINPDDYDRHTALGDARLVRDMYRAITKEVS